MESLQSVKICIICHEKNYENTLIKCSKTNNPDNFYIHFHCSFFFPNLSIGLSKDMNQDSPIIKNFRIKGIEKLNSLRMSCKDCIYCEKKNNTVMVKCYFL